MLTASVLLAAAPSLPAAAPLLGANLEPALSAPDAQDAELARLADSGVRTVRFTLDWNRVEPQPNRFTWRAYDALVNAARARGLEVVLILGPCAEWAVDPAWQVPPDQRSRSLPKSIELWERYVRQSVSHFRGRVRFWQVRDQPNSRNFRGARSEYLRLLAAAARRARAADPAARIIVPEPGTLGLATFDQLLQSATAEHFDILGAYLPPADSNLSGVALHWAALTHEVLGSPDLSRRPPVWILGADPGIPQDKLIAHYLLACAFGVDRCYLPPKAISSDWLRPLAELTYRGFLRLGPDIWALHFEGPQGPAVLAWSPREIEIPASDIAPVADREALERAAPLGAPPGSGLARRRKAARSDRPIALRLGPRPTLIPGLAPQRRARPGSPT
ncbi:MAG: beta-galactosidase, partial [Armatimonadota bacterium]